MRRAQPMQSQSQTQSLPQQQQRPTSTRTGEPLKFEGEFDFEQANARFEEIEKELTKDFSDKLKLKSGTQSLQHQQSDSVSHSLQDLQDQQHLIMKQKSMADDQKLQDNSRLDTSLNHNKDHDAEFNKNFYDKNFSFFDKISCEANEKNMSRMKNWKEERKINSETFGIVQRMPQYRSGYRPQQQRPQQQQQMGYGMRNSASYQSRDSRSSNYGPRSSQPQQQNSMRGGNDSQQQQQRQRGGNQGGYNQSGYRQRQELEVNQPSNRRFGSR